MNDDTTEQIRHGVKVGVDGSDSSARAARWAAIEALARGTSLTLVHAVRLTDGVALPLEPPGYADQRRAEGSAILKLIAETLQAEFPELVLDTKLSDLPATPALAALAAQSELLVTGTRGHGGFTGMLLGSVSHWLAAHAECPLVVVRDEQPEHVLDEVVVGVSSDPEQARGALSYGFASARNYGASVHAVRTWLPYSAHSGPLGSYGVDFTEIRNAEQREVEDLVAPLRASFPEVEVEVTVGRGNPVPLLIETSRETRLVVLGAHRHHGPFAVGAGYVVEGLLAHCPTPVAVVPAR
jgi:nucleotide-binding universal stress UspA family protein